VRVPIDTEVFEVDVLGTRCPVPVAETRRTMRALSKGAIIHLLVDDPEALHDVPALLHREGGRILEVEQRTRGWCIHIHWPGTGG